MSLKFLECLASKWANSDARPRLTTGGGAADAALAERTLVRAEGPRPCARARRRCAPASAINHATAMGFACVDVTTDVLPRHTPDAGGRNCSDRWDSLAAGFDALAAVGTRRRAAALLRGLRLPHPGLAPRPGAPLPTITIITTIITMTTIIMITITIVISIIIMPRDPPCTGALMS